MDPGASAPDPSKEKCEEEEEMKKQPEPRRRNSNEMSRPNMSGCEASAVEETGETEEPEPTVQVPGPSTHSSDADDLLTPSPSVQVPGPSTRSSVNEVAVYSLQTPEPRNRAEFLKYSCQPSLDPNTAHRELRLSEGNRKVTRGETQRYPDHPERFDRRAQVLCREGLSGTRCYWEVEWSGGWTSIGVTYKGIGRKGEGNPCCLGYNDKSWSLFCSDSSYTVMHNNNHTAVTAPLSPRIGVYLDFNAGTLSFYGVSDTMTLLHRFQTTFSEPLYPGFELWRSNSTVIICQLN